MMYKRFKLTIGSGTEVSRRLPIGPIIENVRMIASPNGLRENKPKLVPPITLSRYPDIYSGSEAPQPDLGMQIRWTWQYPTE
jgi:hypothetical protein